MDSSDASLRRDGQSRTNEDVGPPIDLPKGATSTKTKFLFSVKAINLSQSKADIDSKAHKQVLGGDGGEYERYRARLLYLNNRFTSEPSHWTELYAPVIDKTSVRTFLTVCAMKHKYLVHTDVVSAYLHAPLDGDPISSLYQKVRMIHKERYVNYTKL